MPLKATRVLTPETSAENPTGSKRLGRPRHPNKKESPTAEIVELPRARVTRSRSRDEALRGGVNYLYKLEDYKQPRSSRAPSSDPPAREAAQKAPTQRKTQMKKPHDQKKGRFQKANKQQESPDSSEDEWEDVTDEPPVLKRNSRLVPPVPPSNLGRSPIRHTSSPVLAGSANPASTRLRQFQYTETRDAPSDSSKADSHVKASKDQPTTSGSAKTMKNPSVPAPVASTSTQAVKTSASGSMHEEDTVNDQGHHSDDENDPQISELRSKSSRKILPTKRQVQMENQLEREVDLIGLNSYSEAESSPTEEEGEVMKTVRGERKLKKGSTGVRAGEEIIEDLSNNSIGSRVKASENKPTTSGLAKTIRRNPPAPASVASTPPQVIKPSKSEAGNEKDTANPQNDNSPAEDEPEITKVPSKVSGTTVAKKPQPKVKIQLKEKKLSSSSEDFSTDDNEEVADMEQPVQERNNATFNISQASNITLRRYSGQSTALKAAQVKKELPKLPDIPLEEPDTSPNNDDMTADEEEPIDVVPDDLNVEEETLENSTFNSTNTRFSLPVSGPIVRMPYSSPEWKIIENEFEKPCQDVQALKKSILRYHKEKQSDWQFKALVDYVSSMELLYREKFYRRLVDIKTLALQLPELMIENIVIAKQMETTIIKLNQKQVACLLSNAFFCTFSDDAEDDTECGGRFINFSSLFESFESSGDDAAEKNRIIKSKIKCLLAYFNENAGKPPDNPLRIERVYSPHGPTWWTLTESLRQVEIVGSVESSEMGVEVVDSAGLIGGDVFGFSAEEEEINSLVHPELIIVRLCVEPLGDDEALFVSGVQKYSVHQGSGKSFVYTGVSKDCRPRELAYVKWNNVEEGRDFERDDLIAELNKMFIVFKKVQDDYGDVKMVTVGVSRCPEDVRNQIVKFLIVMIAASLKDIPVKFCTYDDKYLNAEITLIQKILLDYNVKIESIFRKLHKYGKLKMKSKPALVAFLKAEFEEC